MKILVISNTAWNQGNSFGNSYNNIFAGLNELTFASIYCRDGYVDSSVNIARAYCINPNCFLKNLFLRKIPTGKEIVLHTSDVEQQQKFIGPTSNHSLKTKLVNLCKILRWQIFQWGLDLLWKVGRWNSEELKDFINDFHPDLLFVPIYYSAHMNDLVLWAKKIAKVPMLGYISDDCYTLRQFSFSPLYWMDRLWKRRKVKRSIEQCEILYVISDIQKHEYEQLFSVPCKVLTKVADFTEPVPSWTYSSVPKLIYAGNIGSGRWKSLALLAKVVECLNRQGKQCELNIYTPTPLSWRMRRALQCNGVGIHPPVDYETILSLQEKADILVHVEGLSLSSRLAVHQSFSTKLVDFFAMGKPILAIGTPDVASIAHLVKNDAAMVASDEEAIYAHLTKAIGHPEILQKYGQRAYECGRKHHNRQEIQMMLRQDLELVFKDCSAVKA